MLYPAEARSNCCPAWVDVSGHDVPLPEGVVGARSGCRPRAVTTWTAWGLGVRVAPMSGPSSSLSALARLRRVTVDTRAREVVRLEERLATSRDRQERAAETLAEQRARMQEETAVEALHLASGKARVIDVLRQDRYDRRAGGELRRLDRAVDEARRQVNADQSALRQAREACAVAWGGQQAVERRRSDVERVLARKTERAAEEDAGDAFMARWRRQP